MVNESNSAYPFPEHRANTAIIDTHVNHYKPYYLPHGQFTQTVPAPLAGPLPAPGFAPAPGFVTPGPAAPAPFVPAAGPPGTARPIAPYHFPGCTCVTCMTQTTVGIKMDGIQKRNEILKKKIEEVKEHKEIQRKQAEITKMELLKQVIKEDKRKKREKQEEKDKIFSGKDLTLMQQLQD